MSAEDAALRAWVEDLAMLFEQIDGVPRMAGRIFGWLLVCDPPEQGLEALATALQGSKASMSTMTRLLLQVGLIEKVRPPGARRDLFRIGPGHWSRVWEQRLRQLGEVTALLDRGLRLLDGRPPQDRHRLEELHAQNVFFERELPRLVERWRRARGVAPPARGTAASGRPVARATRSSRKPGAARA